MMRGHFIISPYPIGSDPYDINFQLSADATGDLPEEQSALKSESEKTLQVMRALFPHGHAGYVTFQIYFRELLGLCQYGLVGPTAQPVQAMDTLKNLQRRIFDNEKGRAISAYMRSVILSQTVLLFAFSVLSVLGAYFLDHIFGLTLFAPNRAPLLAIAPGLLIGAIFSSFIRCRTVTFYDLHAIDADRFSASMRAIFSFVVLLLAGVLLKAELFEIKIGKVEFSAFDRDYLSAFLFGAAVGVAQEAIISRIESIKERLV